MEEARDHTLYWTLSFYIPIEELRSKRAPAEDNRPDDRTLELRQAIEPMFNDIADRTRLGKIEDRLFAGGDHEYLTLIMPEEVRWSTEGKAFRVRIPEKERERRVGLRRFWYVHGNGSLSWHMSFSVFYGDDLARDLQTGSPSTYYFLSLLQKLAWPKEFRGAAQKLSIDDLIGITVDDNTSSPEPFWAFVKNRFKIDSTLIAQLHPNEEGHCFDVLIPSRESIDVPGLECPESRSMFFVRDSRFFALIQPKDSENNLISRREGVGDEEYEPYPRLIARAAKMGKDARKILLGKAYWKEIFSAGGDDARERLAYLFLAGFNQNIIDFTNQEASEVLDSLDPIYPDSDEREEEGFFIRYANPRSLITYVSRSRSLEVGNDFIGTCPYAFLIHALAMHNEALSRAQEESTFKSINAIAGEIRCAEGEGPKPRECYEKAEEMINRVRLDAFEIYERHRYINPFRYDTERSVFEELEKLRGTSRLKLAYKGALAALEEQTRDLARIQREMEIKAAEDARENVRIQHEADQKSVEKHNLTLTTLFGIFSVAGIVGALYQMHEFFWPLDEGASRTPIHFTAGIAYLLAPTFVVVLVIWLLHKRRLQGANRPSGEKEALPPAADE